MQCFTNGVPSFKKFYKTATPHFAGSATLSALSFLATGFLARPLRVLVWPAALLAGSVPFYTYFASECSKDYFEGTSTKDGHHMRPSFANARAHCPHVVVFPTNNAICDTADHVGPVKGAIETLSPNEIETTDKRIRKWILLNNIRMGLSGAAW